MRDILSPSGLVRLRDFVNAPVLLAFDFDGTLAPIVEKPEDAALSERTIRSLAALQGLYPLTVISGRSTADVRARLRGTGVHVVIGNHGIEPSPFMEDAAASLRRWAPILERRVQRVPGVRIENKHYSLAIHYRATPSAAAADMARQAILNAVATLPESVRCVEGLFVVNVLPTGAPDKGDALLRTQQHYRTSASLYVGDDETDEDAFRILDSRKSIGIRIGRDSNSAATFYLRTQLQIDRLLDLLLEFRTQPPTPHPPSAA